MYCAVYTHVRCWLQVGRDEDGKLGPGWFDVTDSELYPMEEKLRMQVAVEALQVRGWVFVCGGGYGWAKGKGRVDWAVSEGVDEAGRSEEESWSAAHAGGCGGTAGETLRVLGGGGQQVIGCCSLLFAVTYSRLCLACIMAWRRKKGWREEGKRNYRRGQRGWWWGRLAGISGYRVEPLQKFHSC